MSVLTPTLRDIRALFRKLERERYRAFHANDILHKADHFYNFCVTAHSLRDYYLVQVGATATDSTTYHELWNAEPVLIAAGDVANSAKHFQLRDRNGIVRTPKTKRVRQRPSAIVNVLVRGSVFDFNQEPVPDLFVTVSDGTSFALYQFLDRVVEYWRVFLNSNGVRIRRQTFKRLSGA